MAHPSMHAFEYHLVSYRRVWRASVLSSFVLPALFLVAMGITVGHYVDARDSGLGFSYLDYIAPGVLATTALQVAVGESTWPIFAAFNWTRTYHAMRAAPLTVPDILRGHLAYVMLRAAMSAAGFLVVLALFGALHSPWSVAALPVALLVALATAAPCFAFAAVVDSDGMFALLYRFAVVPMSLFAGVFFPVTDLPWLVRWLAYGSPLWHAVELCRAATLDTATAWGVPVHVGVLLVWSAVGYLVAVRCFSRKLAD